MKEPVFTELINSLDILVLEYVGDDEFHAIGRTPYWCTYIFKSGQLKQKKCRPQDTMLFLESFLHDAKELWGSKKVEKLKSGPWVETYNSESELAFEASALSINDQEFLLIRYLGEEFNEIKKLYQNGRDNLLAQIQLEQIVSERTREIRHMTGEIAQRLIQITESRDEETGAHVHRMGLYAALIAKCLGWPTKDVDDIRIAATMHDIGKIGIPERILLKPTKLNEEEFNEIKKHPLIGEKILRGSKLKVIQMAREICLAHHEKWDGTGYPYGLIGENIPESARIVSICDVFDALMQKRCYKPAYDLDITIKIMTADRGMHFEPQIFDCFISVLPSMLEILEKNPG